MMLNTPSVETCCVTAAFSNWTAPSMLPPLLIIRASLEAKVIFCVLANKLNVVGQFADHLALASRCQSPDLSPALKISIIWADESVLSGLVKAARIGSNTRYMARYLLRVGW